MAYFYLKGLGLMENLVPILRVKSEWCLVKPRFNLDPNVFFVATAEHPQLV